MRPSPIDLRIALAIFRWLTGRRPVWLECLIRPIEVMYSDIMEKFCRQRMDKLASSSCFYQPGNESTHLVVIERVHIQGIKCICGGTVALPPLLHLCRTQVMRRIDITSLPFSGLESLQDSAFSLRFLVFQELLAVRQSTSC